LLECPWSDDCDCQFKHHDDRRAEARVEQRSVAAQRRRASDNPPDV
jgi:hypothetical protein